MVRKVASGVSTSGTKLKFEKKVKITAIFGRSEKDFDAINSRQNQEYCLRNVYMDDDDLIATANCGSEVFVCYKDEIPELISFLQEIVDGKPQD